MSGLYSFGDSSTDLNSDGDSHDDGTRNKPHDSSCQIDDCDVLASLKGITVSIHSEKSNPV